MKYYINCHNISFPLPYHVLLLTSAMFKSYSTLVYYIPFHLASVQDPKNGHSSTCEEHYALFDIYAPEMNN